MSLITILPIAFAAVWSAQSPTMTFLETADGVTLSIIQADSTWSAGGTEGSYVVQGIIQTERNSIPDTLFWIAGLPSDMVPSLESAGLTEERRLDLLAAGASWISGRIRIRFINAAGRESVYTAFRTWLLDGTELDLDMVVQRDSLFDRIVRDSLGMPREGNIDSWLWRRGFWFDPQSFVLASGEDSLPLLVLGLPSSEGEDTLFTIELPVQLLNTASGSMLD